MNFLRGKAVSGKQDAGLILPRLLWPTKIILAKPLTFMNRSGRAVAALLEYFSLEQDRLLVIYDDLDLPWAGSGCGVAGEAEGIKVWPPS